MALADDKRKRSRRDNFMLSMKNNAEVKRRFGGDLEAAYAAMKREVARRESRDRSKLVGSAGNRIPGKLSDLPKSHTGHSGWDAVRDDKTSQAKEAIQRASARRIEAAKKSKQQPKKTVVTDTSAVAAYRRNKYGQSRSA